MLQSQDGASRFSKLLFADDNGEPLKFKVTRGEHRTRARQLIEENGGELVEYGPSEELFMSLTAPHLATANPDLVSTEYLEDCVAEGALLDAEQYRMTTKGLATGKRTGFRRPFTTEDKNILRTELSRPGVSGTGKAIYQEIARKFPQHTWQSWQSHAKEHILPTLHIERKQNAREKPMEGANLDSGRPTVSSTCVRPNGPAARVKRTRQFGDQEVAILREVLSVADESQREAVYHIMAQKSSVHDSDDWRAKGEEILALAQQLGHFEDPSVPATSKSVLKAEFTRQDRKLMREATRNRIKEVGIQGTKFWRDFATKHKEHGWESWRGHFRHKMVNMLEEADDVLTAVKRLTSQENTHSPSADAPNDDSASASENASPSTSAANPQETQSVDEVSAEEGVRVPLTQAPGSDGGSVSNHSDSEDDDNDDKEGQNDSNALDPVWHSQAINPTGISDTSDSSSCQSDRSVHSEMERVQQKRSRFLSTDGLDPASSPPAYFTQGPGFSPLQTSDDENNDSIEQPGPDHRQHAPIIGASEQEIEALLEQQAKLAQDKGVPGANPSEDDIYDDESEQDPVQLEVIGNCVEVTPSESSSKENESNRDANGYSLEDNTVNDMAGADRVPSSLIPERYEEEGEEENGGDSHVPAPRLPLKRQAKSSLDRSTKRKNGVLPTLPSDTEAPETSQPEDPAVDGTTQGSNNVANENSQKALFVPPKHDSIPRLTKSEQQSTFFAAFDKFASEYETQGYTRKHCVGALHAASGKFKCARKLLDAKLDPTQIQDERTRKRLFSPDDDVALLGGDEEAVFDLRLRKGRENISNRMKFLQQWAALHYAVS